MDKATEFFKCGFRYIDSQDDKNTEQAGAELCQAQDSLG